MRGLTQRVFKLSNGNRVRFTKNPPFDFWTVNYDKGGLPSTLSGQFTSFHLAMRAFEGHMGKRKIEIVEEEPWPDQPVM